jgi:hypothetical protein
LRQNNEMHGTQWGAPHWSRDFRRSQERRSTWDYSTTYSLEWEAIGVTSSLFTFRPIFYSYAAYFALNPRFCESFLGSVLLEVEM